MKSKTLNSSSAIRDLYIGKRLPQSVEDLEEAGISRIEDLMRLFPLRIEPIPPVQSFSQTRIGHLFSGRGRIVSIKSHPTFRGRGRRRALLYDASLLVQEHDGTGLLKLQWFNAYKSMVEKLKGLERVTFMGEVSDFHGQKQLVAPQIEDDTGEIASSLPARLIQYPTVNSVSGFLIQKCIAKIPDSLWDSLPERLPESLRQQHQLPTWRECIRTLHGIGATWTSDAHARAFRRLVYEEFFDEQLKVIARKQSTQARKAPIIRIPDNEIPSLLRLFPFQFTPDQVNSLNDIRHDLKSGHAMMRLIQGDVGCGKTAVALGAALIASHCGYQTALMCPTESLALQHLRTAKTLLEKTHLRIGLLISGLSTAQKKETLHQLASGEIDLVIGTHALFQKQVRFHKLALAMIDEQHKFGVEQRLSLVAKGVDDGAHCLILTATPIPRSLCLTRYGDLDISVIKTMPTGRKGAKTKIVTPETFEHFLTFVATRISIGEQVYVVAPAIGGNDEDDEQNADDLDLHTVESVTERMTRFFPKARIASLHGQLPPEDKMSIFTAFGRHEIDILISTTVIEVGIDVHNATVMAVLNPERFGLSSLHQLRGRVGRGEKQGFFFLILDQTAPSATMERLQLIVETNDGLMIAEKDLEWRGQGDVFGTEQSGDHTSRYGNVITHQDLLLAAVHDSRALFLSQDPCILERVEELQRALLITRTV